MARVSVDNGTEIGAKDKNARLGPGLYFAVLCDLLISRLINYFGVVHQYLFETEHAMI